MCRPFHAMTCTRQWPLIRLVTDTYNIGCPLLGELIHESNINGLMSLILQITPELAGLEMLLLSRIVSLLLSRDFLFYWAVDETKTVFLPLALSQLEKNRLMMARESIRTRRISPTWQTSSKWAYRRRMASGGAIDVKSVQAKSSWIHGLLLNTLNRRSK